MKRDRGRMKCKPSACVKVKNYNLFLPRFAKTHFIERMRGFMSRKRRFMGVSLFHAMQRFRREPDCFADKSDRNDEMVQIPSSPRGAKRRSNPGKKNREGHLRLSLFVWYLKFHGETCHPWSRASTREYLRGWTGDRPPYKSNVSPMSVIQVVSESSLRADLSVKQSRSYSCFIGSL